MRSQLENIFEKLNSSNCIYCVFKGLDFADQIQLNTKKDIDLLVQDWKSFSLIAENLNYRLVQSPNRNKHARFYISWLTDEKTEDYQLLHVHSTPSIIIKKGLFKNVWRFSTKAEVLRNIETPSQKMAARPSKEWLQQFNLERKNYKSKQSMFRLSIRDSIHETVEMLLKRTLFRHSPSYPIRRFGLLITFVGIDGSGKTSTIREICNSRYMQLTQRPAVMYFGSSKSRIWFVDRLARYESPRTGHRPFLGIRGLLKAIERKLLLLVALYHRLCGRTVICDRYFYDATVANLTNKRRSQLSKLLNKFNQWMPMRPSMTFYLKLDPDLAYARKKEHTPSVMAEMSKAFDNALLRLREVVKIDASQPHGSVIKEIRTHLDSIR